MQWKRGIRTGRIATYHIEFRHKGGIHAFKIDHGLIDGFDLQLKQDCDAVGDPIELGHFTHLQKAQTAAERLMTLWRCM